MEENLGSNILPNTGMVNFEKMRAVFTALRAVKYFQSYSYIFPEVPALIKLILVLSFLFPLYFQIFLIYYY